MKTHLALALLGLALTPMTAFAAPKATAGHHKKASPTTYECQKCHMRVSASVAKKDHYKDPMDGGKFAPVKAAKK